MLTTIRTRFNSLRKHSKTRENCSDETAPQSKPERNKYCRPAFLNLTEEETLATDNHETRPIVAPKTDSALPWNAGYAECVCVRMKKNEDQAAVGEIKLDHELSPEQQEEYATDSQAVEASLRGLYFGVFDGHGGSGAALMVADQLINHLQEKLVDVQKDLFDLALLEHKKHRLASQGDDKGDKPSSDSPCKLFGRVTFDDLIIGALVSAFHAMDEHIAGEKASFTITGGCCTLVALFFFGKLYIANAGDCRAVAYIDDRVIPLSTDFTAEQDADRIYSLARNCPELVKGYYSTNQFYRSVRKSDVGSRLLCRTLGSSGWSRKEVTDSDLYPPLVDGTKKGARLMNCIGISRSLGDHDLKDSYTSLSIKPFLSCTPEVKVLDVGVEGVREGDVVVMGSDGLWDNLTNQHMGKLVRAALDDATDHHSRYNKAARQVVLQAQGSLDTDRPGWRSADGEEASYDDITAMVIPLHLAANYTRINMSGGEQSTE